MSRCRGITWNIETQLFFKTIFSCAAFLSLAQCSVYNNGHLKTIPTNRLLHTLFTGSSPTPPSWFAYYI
jgi:hypothetical protein